MSLHGSLSDDFIKSLIRHSYAEIVRKLPRMVKVTHTEITETEG